ncbi:MAG TPA: hypothetical protein VMT91_14420 [Anaerolineales bacterium]|nr:hypothetical protein [Anaerolineales bacterium]
MAIVARFKAAYKSGGTPSATARCACPPAPKTGLEQALKSLKR